MLPANAADAHLEQHPLDTEGPCETVDDVAIDSAVIEEETSMTVVESKATKKKK